ncbi:MAG: Holliday junction resolvase RuvX [Endomicrobium sp.]|jgi:putative Holliday junction resolvase|nr:Holliday junction resolvase RuvX [Endomicrobium sp.]
MSRLMGIDYGLKRMGVAMTDIMQTMAIPFDTIESLSLKENASKILEIAENNDVSIIVLGLPVNMNGSEGEMAATVRKLIEIIKSVSNNVKVELIDERLTTVQAERILINDAGISRKKRKGLKDKIAAVLILQTYLDIQG